MELIAEERKQLEDHGLTDEQQNIAEQGELAGAAACYALMGSDYFGAGRRIVPGLWPMRMDLFEPELDELTRLARAAALLSMEIERLQRAKDDRRIVTLIT
jgi:hypothetical protein